MSKFSVRKKTDDLYTESHQICLNADFMSR